MSRIRTNSVSILNDDGDDVIATSYGPVVLPEAPNRNRDWMLGWFLAIISGVLFTANNFFVKYLSMDALEMLLIRSALQTIVVLIGLLSTRTSLIPGSTKDKILVVLQGLLSGVRVFLQFACLSFMPLGDALTLVFTEPLWTIILSKIVLRIHIGWWKTVFGILLVTGMVLCIQPPFIFPPSILNNATVSSTPTPISSTPLTTTSTEFPYMHTTLNHSESPYMHTAPNHYNTGFATNMTEVSQTTRSLISQFARITGVDDMKESYKASRDLMERDEGYTGTYYIGVVLALGTAVIGSTANVFIAKCEDVSSSVMVFYSGLGGVVAALACGFMDKDNRIIFDIGSIPYDEWLILLMLGGSGLLGYYSMTRSLQLIPPTTVAVLRALEIILAYVAQAAVMGEIPNVLAISGSSMVMLCVIGFAMEETVMSCYNCY